MDAEVEGMVVGIEEDVGIIAEAVPVHVPRAGRAAPQSRIDVLLRRSEPRQYIISLPF